MIGSLTTNKGCHGGESTHAVKVFAAISTAALLVAPAFLPEAVKNYLQFDRAALISSEFWRLWTGHFVHFSTAHLVVNLATFFLIGYLCFWRGRIIPYFSAMLIIPAATSLAVYYCFDQPLIFRGFSGASHGLLAFGIFLLWDRSKYASSILLLLLGVKLGYEHMPSYDRRQMIAAFTAPVAVEAHLSGALVGIILGSIYRLSRRFFYRNYLKYGAQSATA